MFYSTSPLLHYSSFLCALRVLCGESVISQDFFGGVFATGAEDAAAGVAGRAAQVQASNRRAVIGPAGDRALDPNSMQEVTRQDFYSEHKEVGGILTPHRVIVLHDGDPFADLEVTEARYLERHPAETFAKP